MKKIKNTLRLTSMGLIAIFSVAMNASESYFSSVDSVAYAAGKKSSLVVRNVIRGFGRGWYDLLDVGYDHVWGNATSSERIKNIVGLGVLAVAATQLVEIVRPMERSRAVTKWMLKKCKNLTLWMLGGRNIVNNIRVPNAATPANNIINNNNNNVQPQQPGNGGVNNIVNHPAQAPVIVVPIHQQPAQQPQQVVQQHMHQFVPFGGRAYRLNGNMDPAFAQGQQAPM